MKFELNDWKAQLTDEEIITDIQETAKRLGKDYISIPTYKTHGKYSQTAIQAHFGGWRNALSIAGLRNERRTSELKLITDDELCIDLRKVAQSLNSNTITWSEYETNGKYSPYSVLKRFGRWDNALKIAGLDSTGYIRDKITEQECFNEIERMWRLLGRQPTATDIIKGTICRYSIDTFKRRFGGWRKALEAFVVYINAEDNEYEPKVSEAVKTPDCQGAKEKEGDVSEIASVTIHRTSRNINTRLRFKVLARDNFKCCACGASPAKDPAVELHVDHIVPWSKGGETTIDNLQTLCSKCNLGKSDLLID